MHKVQEAVAVLHGAGFVHGFICREHILVREGEELSVMLVGFEWAGKAGQARYPVSLDTFERAFWAMV